MKKNITLLYGFSFLDQFMIVIALWIPYLTTQGISMRQFMELQAVFAIVILCGEVPSGLLSDLCGRKNSYEGFLVYHLTMGIALSMISGGDVALLWASVLSALGVLFTIVFVVLLLPLVLRETASSPEPEPSR